MTERSKPTSVSMTRSIAGEITGGRRWATPAACPVWAGNWSGAPRFGPMRP
jgi:hypothetical protein